MGYSYAWTKTLLSSLCYIKSVCCQIDGALLRRAAVITGINSSYDGEFDSTLTQIGKVVSLIEKKKRTIRLFTMSKEVLSRMLVTYRKSLLLKFNTKKSGKEVEGLLGCTMRSFFRYIREGLNQFTAIRERLGYSDEYLDGLYKDDKWVMRLKLKAEDDEILKKNLERIHRKGYRAA